LLSFLIDQQCWEVLNFALAANTAIGTILAPALCIVLFPVGIIESSYCSLKLDPFEMSVLAVSAETSAKNTCLISSNS